MQDLLRNVNKFLSQYKNIDIKINICDCVTISYFPIDNVFLFSKSLQNKN